MDGAFNMQEDSPKFYSLLQQNMWKEIYYENLVVTWIKLTRPYKGLFESFFMKFFLTFAVKQ